MYVTEAGLRAVDEGCDALVMDTVSDSGLGALRARLSIPDVGLGVASYAVAMILGSRFSIITMVDSQKAFYEKTLNTYRVRDRCVSIRAVNVGPDPENLFDGHEAEMFKILDRRGAQTRYG